jgi:hypothetical protein
MTNFKYLLAVGLISSASAVASAQPAPESDEPSSVAPESTPTEAPETVESPAESPEPAAAPEAAATAGASEFRCAGGNRVVGCRSLRCRIGRIRHSRGVYDALVGSW